LKCLAFVILIGSLFDLCKHCGSLFGDNINELLDPLKDRERLDPLSNMYEVQKSAKTKTNC
jgi:hypothetical protein